MMKKNRFLAFSRVWLQSDTTKCYQYYNLKIIERAEKLLLNQKANKNSPKTGKHL